MIEEKIRALLALQQEIDTKVDDYITRVKAILKSERDEKGKNRLIFDIDGEIYELIRQRETIYAVNLCRKHNGFFHEYRFVNLGKPGIKIREMADHLF
jgi:mRNA-degrading endonuclease HigB of HigAB toxin-antitoxin module